AGAVDAGAVDAGADDAGADDAGADDAGADDAGADDAEHYDDGARQHIHPADHALTTATSPRGPKEG
ncbi:MAG: hypothetical protein M3501_00980, partial [Actinomycetota bacterium]|nr:hypothetical protein [Actinomycetota bacterium]